jgi:hypothetical protein
VKYLIADGLRVKVDDVDHELLAKYVWHIKWRSPNHPYVFRFEKRSVKHGFASQYRCVRMHRQIMGFPTLSVDHKNGDTLDNRRSNLREATQSQQGQNARHHNGKKYKGVTFIGKIHGKYESRRPWRARIRVQGKLIALGHHPTAEHAARIYNKAAKKHFGEFAALNKIPRKTA